MDSNNKIFRAGDRVKVSGVYWNFVEYTTDNEMCVLHQEVMGWITVPADEVELFNAV